MGFLDKTGITRLVTDLKTYFQEKLVSGTNIKTINNNSLLGSGNISISGGGGTSDYDQLSNRPQINSVTLTGNQTSSALSLASASHTHTKSEITDFPTIQTISTITDTADNKSVSGNSYADFTLMLEPQFTGTYLGIVQIKVVNATSGGSNGAYCFVSNYTISSLGSISYRIQNRSSSAAKVKVTFTALYVSEAPAQYLSQ